MVRDSNRWIDTDVGGYPGFDQNAYPECPAMVVPVESPMLVCPHCAEKIAYVREQAAWMAVCLACTFRSSVARPPFMDAGGAGMLLD